MLSTKTAEAMYCFMFLFFKHSISKILRCDAN